MCIRKQESKASNTKTNLRDCCHSQKMRYTKNIIGYIVTWQLIKCNLQVLSQFIVCSTRSRLDRKMTKIKQISSTSDQISVPFITGGAKKGDILN